MSSYDINIYPNPASTDLYIEWNTKEVNSISIIDLLGRVLYKIKVDHNSEKVDISELPSGVYMVVINESWKELFVVK